MVLHLDGSRLAILLRVSSTGPGLLRANCLEVSFPVGSINSINSDVFEPAYEIHGFLGEIRNITFSAEGEIAAWRHQNRLMNVFAKLRLILG